jgi:hypothetical protein
MGIFGTQTALGIDLDDGVVRLVELRAVGTRVEVLRAVRCPQPEAATADDLALVLHTLGVHRGRAACALPSAGCTIKVASLPPASPAELQQVAHFEAASQFPLPLDELIWDVAFSPEPTGRQHAVIAGCRRGLVDLRMAAVQAAGAIPILCLPTALAAAAAITPPAGIHLLISAGERWSELCLMDGPRLLACRSLHVGAPTTDDWGARLAREARPWLAGGTPPETVTLLGGLTPEEAHHLEAAIGLPVRLGDPWAEIQDPHGQLQTLEDPPGAYMTALGLAKAALARRPGLNLLPAPLTAGYVRQRRLAWTLAGLVLGIGLLLPLTLAGGRALAARQAEVRAATRLVQEARAALPAPPSAGARAAQRTLAALTPPESQPLELLRLLSVKLPAGLSLTEFAYTRGKAVLVLKGRADSHDVLSTALRALDGLPAIERALLDYATVGDAGLGCAFQITCLLPATDDPTLVTKSRRSGARRAERSRP